MIVISCSSSHCACDVAITPRTWSPCLVTSCLAFLLLIIFGIIAFVSANKEMKRSNKPVANAVMSAVLLVLSIPALAGCWSFLTRTATYDIGPADQAGFWILYLIFVLPVLCFCCIAPLLLGGGILLLSSLTLSTSTCSGIDSILIVSDD